jgi:1,5-anhydro-D-fructose reductase (1,5-anhydro-D-mannitol-forming)
MRWGLVGASTIADEHMVWAIRSVAGSDIGWVVSGSDAHGKAFAAEHGIPNVTTDLARMLADPSVGAVYISSTNDKHHPQAMAAIAAGKHVLCEKPLAMTVADAAGMVRAAADKGVIFATNHHLRNAGSHRAIRDLIASGRIGRVLSVRVHHAVLLPPHLQGWRIESPDAGGGVIPDITVHDADTVRFLLGEDPVTVVAQSGVSGMGQGVEDSVMSVWSMPSGAMVMAHESFTHVFGRTGIEVYGTEGAVFARGVMTQEPLGRIDLVTARERTQVQFRNHDLYDEGVAVFSRATSGRGRPSADGNDGVKSLAVALAVRDAARTGQRQTVDYGDR